MDLLVVMAILGLVVVFVSAPLRRLSEPRVIVPEMGDEARQPEVLELEAARDAKLRELRDVELDHRTGKLSDADYQELDSALRAEAIEILRALDEARDRAEQPS
jgi:hypothetical protein